MALPAFLVAASSASAAPGDLIYRDCISSDTNQATCAQLPVSTAGGSGTALASARDAVASPDGAHLYVTAFSTVSWFTRSATTGALAFGGCLTGSTNTAGCQAISTATGDSSQSGMSSLTDLAISPDGRNVFATTNLDDSLTRFSRDPSTGALTYQGCVSSDSALNGRCTLLATHTANANNTALWAANSVVVSPDGANIYVASPFSSALTRFGRNPDTGAFTGFQDCITGDTNVSGTGACASVGGAAVNAQGHRMRGLTALSAAPDGKTIVGAGSSSVVDFSRGLGGALNMGSCVTSNTDTTGCSWATAFAPGGNKTPLSGPSEVTVSPSNDNVYVGSINSDAVSVIGRNASTGALEGFEGCRTSSNETLGCIVDPGAGVPAHLDLVTGVAVSPDSSRLYVVSENGDALTRNDRRAGDGAFFFDRCFSPNTAVAACTRLSPSSPDGAGTPFNRLQAVVPSADGKDVYVVSDGATVARFEIEGTRPPVTPPGGQPPDGTAPSNDITLGRVAKNKKKGTAKLTVAVPGPGELGLDGNGVAERSATAAAAGDLTLKLKAEDNKRKKLRRKGKVKVTARITFTPVGGNANTESAKVKLIDR